MLAAIESLLSAVVADNMSGDRHKPDAELLAQGVANLIVPMFGGIPATGAIARTATNIRSGATSPVAGIVHALTLLAIVLAAAPLARFIPLPTLAAILMIVAYRMGEWHEIPSILRLSGADRAVWAATFALTVFADLTVAVEVGMLLAALLFIHRVASTTTVASVTDEMLGDGEPRVLTDKYIPAYCSVIRIRGPFLFGATEKLEHATADRVEIRLHRRAENDVHVGHRRHRHPRAGKAGEAAARVRPIARAVRRPAAAGRIDRAIEAGQADRPAKSGAASRRGPRTGRHYSRRLRQPAGARHTRPDSLP